MVPLGSVFASIAAQQPRYRTNRRSIVFVADTILNQFGFYFMAKHARLTFFQLFDFIFDFRCGHAWLWSANDTGPNRSRFLVAIQNFRHTSMRHTQRSRNLARSHIFGGHFNDFAADMIGKWSTVDKDAAQLIHTSLALKVKRKKENNYYSVKKNWYKILYIDAHIFIDVYILLFLFRTHIASSMGMVNLSKMKNHLNSLFIIYLWKIREKACQQYYSNNWCINNRINRWKIRSIAVRRCGFAFDRSSFIFTLHTFFFFFLFRKLFLLLFIFLSNSMYKNHSFLVLYKLLIIIYNPSANIAEGGPFKVQKVPAILFVFNMWWAHICNVYRFQTYFIL